MSSEDMVNFAPSLRLKTSVKVLSAPFRSTADLRPLEPMVDWNHATQPDACHCRTWTFLSSS
ncbi:hypothetical protein QW131_21425 [Roseibium salinum]|nr:hypothetical protein [Roseibium salinum]